eukprot:GCRY01000398.1.p1 GENE.GCRY01000398.1~~GCRY01000398.1.p1  ORF type:complete len:346 (-),score=103.89 GCRY01000398.1:725-1762(-)
MSKRKAETQLGKSSKKTAAEIEQADALEKIEQLYEQIEEMESHCPVSEIRTKLIEGCFLAEKHDLHACFKELASDIAGTYSADQDFDNCISWCQKALDAAEKMSDEREAINAKHQLACAYAEAGKHAEALPLYQNVLDVCMKKEDQDSLTIGCDSLQGLARAFAETGVYEEAQDMVDKLKKVAEKTNALLFEMMALESEAHLIRLQQKDHKKAAHIIKKLEEITEENENQPEFYCGALTILKEWYTTIGDKEKEKEYEEKLQVGTDILAEAMEEEEEEEEDFGDLVGECDGCKEEKEFDSLMTCQECETLLCNQCVEKKVTVGEHKASHKMARLIDEEEEEAEED